VRPAPRLRDAHGAGTVVLGQGVLVELGERRCHALLYLRGEGLTSAGPVDGDELAQLVGALDDTRKRVGHQTAMRGVTRHLANEQKRSMTQLHTLAGLNGQRGDLFSLDLRNQLVDAAGDLHAVLIELAFPQQAGEDRAAQSLLGGDDSGPCSLVSARSRLELEHVQAHGAPPF
jgi:hypothetical protein